MKNKNKLKKDFENLLRKHQISLTALLDFLKVDYDKKEWIKEWKK